MLTILVIGCVTVLVAVVGLWHRHRHLPDDTKYWGKLRADYRLQTELSNVREPRVRYEHWA